MEGHRRVNTFASGQLDKRQTNASARHARAHTNTHTQTHMHTLYTHIHSYLESGLQDTREMPRCLAKVKKKKSGFFRKAEGAEEKK